MTNEQHMAKIIDAMETLKESIGYAVIIDQCIAIVRGNTHEEETNDPK